MKAAELEREKLFFPVAFEVQCITVYFKFNEPYSSMKYHKIAYFMIDFGERVLKPVTIDQYLYF